MIDWNNMQLLMRRQWDLALEIWVQGGWAMPAIALVALVMFAMGLHIFLTLRATGFLSVSEKKWRRWIDHSNERRGPIGEMLDFVTGGRSIDDMAASFNELKTAEFAPFTRDLKVMKVCVGAAPLLGLLGTVTGMLATFNGLASGAGGEKTMGLIASGISEALITTEAGLVVALPGLYFQYQLSRLFDRYKVFLTHMETVCTQRFYHRQKAAERLASKQGNSPDSPGNGTGQPQPAPGGGQG